jgi:hypothetical protein
MKELDMRLAQARFARRHLSKMAGMGLAALFAALTMPKPAQARHGEDNDHDRDDRGGWGDPNCFLKGTRIRTVDGERAVEDLAVGDLLPTHCNGIRAIQRIGRHKYTRRDASKAWAVDALPVRVARSALSPNVPHSDLYLSPQHAIFADGVLVRAGSLVNGTTIAPYDAGDLASLNSFTSSFKAMTSSTPKALRARRLRKAQTMSSRC